MAIKIKKKKEKAVEEVEATTTEEALEPDAFVQASAGFWTWMQKNWRLVVAGVGAIIVLYVGVWIYINHTENAAIEQSAALNLALDAHRTPTKQEIEERKFMMRLEMPQVDSSFYDDFKSFDNAQSREEAVLQGAEKVIDTYSDSEVAGEAHLLAASAAHRLGETDKVMSNIDEAQKAVSEEAQVFVLQAKAVQLTDEEKFADAIKVYEQIAELGPRFYGAFSLMQQGRLYEVLEDTEAAANSYAEVVARYPEAIQVRDARQRLGLLTDDPDARISAIAVD